MFSAFSQADIFCACGKAAMRRGEITLQEYIKGDENEKMILGCVARFDNTKNAVFLLVQRGEWSDLLSEWKMSRLV